MDKDYIKEQIDQLKLKKDLSGKERKRLRRLESKFEERKNLPSINLRPFLSKAILLFISIAVFGGFIWYASSRPSLPPTDIQGHTEENPSSHIIDKPMPEAIQKHMLEHADGQGAPGVLVQYNCQKFSCEDDLINKLKSLAEKHPENVYLAPGNYDGKIILTKLGKRQILDNFDEQKIDDFIE